MNTDLHFSSKNSEWQTPPELYKTLDSAYHFTLDVACTMQNCLAPHGLYVEEHDALKDDWKQICDDLGKPRVCFMNPPYGRNVIDKWVKKAYTESLDGVTVVCLIPARTCTSWFQDYCSKGQIHFVRGRLKFYDPNMPEEKKKYNKKGELKLDPAPFPSAIVEFNRNNKPYISFSEK